MDARSQFFLFSALGSMLILFLLAPLIALLLVQDPRVLSQVFSEPSLYMEMEQSLIVLLEASLTSTLLLAVLGIPLAYVLARFDFRGKGVVESIVDMPLMLPHTVAGIMVLAAYGSRGLLRLGIEDTFWGVVAVMMFVSAPLLVDSVRVAVEKVDVMLEVVARSLGAGPLRVFASVTLPLSMNGVAAGVVLAWARAVSEVGALLIVAYYPKTASILVLEWLNTYGLPYAAALSLVLVCISLAFFTAFRLLRRGGAVLSR